MYACYLAGIKTLACMVDIPTGSLPCLLSSLLCFNILQCNRWWATTEPCEQQVFLYILIFPRGLLPKRSIVCIQPSLLFSSGGGGRGSCAGSSFLCCCGPPGTRAALWQSRSPCSDSRRRSHKHCPTWRKRWNNGILLFLLVFASPLCSIINGSFCASN